VNDYAVTHRACGTPHRPGTPCPTDHAVSLTTASSHGGRPTVQLVCGHVAEVPGPAGTPTGRAWCIVCGESAAVRAHN
jgi:hypothetical protein